jgi:hypothetical protein
MMEREEGGRHNYNIDIHEARELNPIQSTMQIHQPTDQQTNPSKRNPRRADIPEQRVDTRTRTHVRTHARQARRGTGNGKGGYVASTAHGVVCMQIWGKRTWVGEA